MVDIHLLLILFERRSGRKWNELMNARGRKMIRVKRQNPYQAISVQKEQLTEIKEHLEKYYNLHISIAEFVRYSIQNQINNDKRMIKCKKEP